MLFKQTATRYTSAWHHTQPVWYFLEVIAAFWLPFSLALPWLFPRWRDAFRARDARVWLPLGWALLVLVFFSASPGKRDMYILPMLPMVAVAAGPYLEGVTASKWFRRILLALVVVLGIAFFGAGVAALQGDPSFEVKIEAERGLAPASDTLWWLLAITGAAMLAVCCVVAARCVEGVRGRVVAAGRRVVLGHRGAARCGELRARGDGARPRAGRRCDARPGRVEGTEPAAGARAGRKSSVSASRSTSNCARASRGWKPRRKSAACSCNRMRWMRACCASAAQAVGTANRRTWWLFDADAIAPACRASGH